MTGHPVCLPNAIERKSRSKIFLYLENTTEEEKVQALIHHLGLDNIPDVPKIVLTSLELFTVNDARRFKDVN